LDVHCASFTLAVLTPKGKLSQCLSRSTSAEQLIEVVQAVPGPKTLIVEECHLAQWVKRTLEPYVDRLIVCDPQRNSWIAKDEFNDDKSSARKLAHLHQGGYLKEIRHPSDAGAGLRSLFLHYYDLTHQLIRFKNKLKAVFRQEAMATAGKEIYAEEGHERRLRRLKGQAHLRHEARQLFGLVDQLEACKQESYDTMVKRAKRIPAFPLLDGMPGAGGVIVTGYVALLETPHRFSRRNRVRRYAGFGNRYQRSDEVVYDKHSSHSGNRPLKWVVEEHFQGAVPRCKQSNRFQRQYHALPQRGLDSTAAHRHVCRALTSTAWAIWRKEEPYRDDLLS
jgi:hypothetical protein